MKLKYSDLLIPLTMTMPLYYFVWVESGFLTHWRFLLPLASLAIIYVISIIFYFLSVKSHGEIIKLQQTLIESNERRIEQLNQLIDGYKTVVNKG